MRLLLIFASAVQGVWMLADGIHALRSGHYYGSRLGPWAAVVLRVGIDPNSSTMRWIFVALGVLWLVVLVLITARVRHALTLALVTAIMTLWFLPIGTLLSVMTIVCALLLSRGATTART
jgi:hypothetical protein